MTNSQNDKQQPAKKLDAKSAEKLREQLANRIAELSDEDLETIAGGGEGLFTWSGRGPNTIMILP